MSGCAGAPPPSSAELAVRLALRAVVHTVGRKREAGWESLAVAEYTKRLARGSPAVLARVALHPSQEALRIAAIELMSPVLVLDERGEQLSTEEFGALLFGRLFAAEPRVSFVIGGAEGLPEELRTGQGFRRVSLSRLTLPHRVAHVLLLEQMFRARELRAGSGYHRGG